MRLELPKLPYRIDALTPLISAETLEFHYGRHHRTYVEQVNLLSVGTAFAKASLKDIVRHASGPLFNNASQAWNHTFYWNSLAPPDGQLAGTEAFAAQVKRDFGSLDSLKRAFRACALAAFGSGWIWLVKNEAGRLRVIETQNAESPIRADLRPLLVCDVWEHAYYIDYRNERAKYVDAFLKLMNIEFAGHCFEFEENEVPLALRRRAGPINQEKSYG